MITIYTFYHSFLNLQSNYIQHKELYGAQGCKITGKDLEKVMAGAPVFVAEHPDEIEVLKVRVFWMSSFRSVQVLLTVWVIHKIQLF